MSTYRAPESPAFRVSPVTVALLLLGAALVTWILTVDRMRGMDAGPGTDLGGLAWFTGIWVTMMAAMMFPSAAPMVMVFHRVSTERAKRGQTSVPAWMFSLSYLAVWTLYGLAAYGLYRLVVHFDFGFLDWDRGGRYVAGGAIVAAGLYELTPLKSVCLRYCRTPLHFVMGHWREGRLGALRMGAEHGAYCVGCCWALMIVLFALGVMSLTWMALVAVLILAQKVLPYGERLTRVFAVAFVAAGIWMAAAPASVPGLTLPNSDAAERARMRMMGMTPGSEMKPGEQMKPGGQMNPGSQQMRQPGAQMQPGTTMDSGSQMQPGSKMQTGAEMDQMQQGR
jgi:predicted metal-binding membrane protein